MKKLNRKGFTLIELLAVIVILAVVLVVTIPSVINAMNTAREKSLENSANTIADWFQKNYDIDQLGPTLGAGAEASYYTFLGCTQADTSSCKTLGSADATTLCSTTSSSTTCNAVMQDVGINTPEKNIASGTITLNGTKVCVTLSAKAKGSFYSTRSGATNTAKSANCPQS